MRNRGCMRRPSWSWLYGSWIYKNICNQCQSPQLWVWIPLRRGVLNATLWLETARWFSPGPPVSSTNKTDRHDITEILLKAALSTIHPPFVCVFLIAFRIKFYKQMCISYFARGRRGHGCMVVGFTTSYAISACHYIVALSFVGGGNRSYPWNNRPATSHRQHLSHIVVSSTPRLSGIRTHNIYCWK
jgi:hypothetical protein